MNSLSWFLYVIDVISNLKELSWIVLFVVGFSWAGLNAVVPLSEGEILEWKEYRLWWFRGLISLMIFSLVYCVLPTSQTLYAIAASEAGEKLVKSEQVQGIASDAQKALQQWIKRQIEPEPAKK